MKSNCLLWSLLSTYTLLVVWYHGVTAPRPSSLSPPLAQRHDQAQPQLTRLAFDKEILVAIPDGRPGTDPTTNKITSRQTPDSGKEMQQRRETTSENHPASRPENHRRRRLPGAAGGGGSGYPTSMSEEQVMQVLAAVLLLLLVCILFMCCCCGRFSMCDCLALVCIWEICCNDAGVDALVGDFVLV